MSRIFRSSAVALAVLSILTIFPSSAAAATLGSYRWRNDDGAQATATFYGAEDTAISRIGRNVPVRLRFAAGNSGTESDLTRIAAAAFNPGEFTALSGVIDTINGYAYFATDGSPAKIVKVSLGAGNAAPVRVGSLTLDTGEAYLYAAVIDAVNGYAYFGTNGSSKVIKVALGEGDALPTRIGALTLAGGESGVFSGVIDADNGYAYFGIDSSPGKVVKVALGAGDALPTRIGVVTANAGEAYFESAVIDPANGYAYFGTWSSPGRVVKIALGAGAAAPTRVGAVTANAGENIFAMGAIDTTNGYAYFGAGTATGIVVKIALGAGAAAPTRVGAVSLDAGENFFTNSVALDTVNGFGYFGTNSSPAKVVKVALGAGAAAPTRVGAITAGPGENLFYAVGIDVASGYIYFGTGGSPMSVVKVSIIPKAAFRLEYSVKTTTCAAVSSWTRVAAMGASVSEEWEMLDSANITDGAATTNVASGLTDPNTTFIAGQIKDISSQTSLIPLGLHDFTELEYSIAATGNADTGTNYCFRVTNAGTATVFSVDNYAEATVLFTGSPARGQAPSEPVVEPVPIVDRPPTEDTNNPPSSGSTPNKSYVPSEEISNTPDINIDKGLVAPSAGTNINCVVGSLIKGTLPAVYYCGADGKRYVFVNNKAYLSWYPDFSSVIKVSDATLASIPIGGNITYRPGVRMVKIVSDPKTYAVARGGVLRWIQTEAAAIRLYGATWNKQIDDLPDSFFTNYVVGDPITE